MRSAGTALAFGFVMPPQYLPPALSVLVRRVARQHRGAAGPESLHDMLAGLVCVVEGDGQMSSWQRLNSYPVSPLSQAGTL